MIKKRLRSFILRSVVLVIAYFIIAFISAAFMAGYTNCVDCDTTSKRIFLGIIWVFLGILTQGKIPQDEGDMSNIAVNIWPDVYLIWAVLLLLSIGLMSFFSGQKKP